MTLVVTLATEKEVFQISDKRLTRFDGSVFDDNYLKATSLRCENARFLVGFTGFATDGQGHDTQTWLLETLGSCGAPDYTAQTVLENFRQKASEKFQTLQRRFGKNITRTSFMFSGHLDYKKPADFGMAIVTNYQDLKNGTESAEAQDRFTMFSMDRVEPDLPEFFFAERIGARGAFLRTDAEEFRNILRAGKSHEITTSRLAGAFRHLADRPAAGGVVGKNIFIARLQRDGSDGVSVANCPEGAASCLYMPNSVVARGSNQLMIKGATIVLGNADQTVKFVRKAGRNKPCPCGSNKKYKYCHGPQTRP